MKQANVCVGLECCTKVCGRLVAVKVIDVREGWRKGTHKRFVVQRLDNGKVLPKSRTAAALR